ncbi:hypothetical protein HK101_009781 [Irineochytrium annulatum]|nr:hypothetical protein HK101_009781 [Irineochytrium annulatum]
MASLAHPALPRSDTVQTPQESSTLLLQRQSSSPCSLYYTTVSTDTCASVATNFGMTQSYLFGTLNPGVTCAVLPAGGATLCVRLASAGKCDYQTAVDMTPGCASVAAAHGLQLNEFERINPGLPCPSPSGTYKVCLGSDIPVNNCYATHEVQPAETCATIAAANGMTIAYLQSLNPTLDCTKLGIYPVDVCVRGNSAPPCTLWAAVGSAQGGCVGVETTYGLTRAQIMILNPGLDCANIAVTGGDDINIGFNISARPLFAQRCDTINIDYVKSRRNFVGLLGRYNVLYHAHGHGPVFYDCTVDHAASVFTTDTSGSDFERGATGVVGVVVVDQGGIDLKLIACDILFVLDKEFDDFKHGHAEVVVDFYFGPHFLHFNFRFADLQLGVDVHEVFYIVDNLQIVDYVLDHDRAANDCTGHWKRLLVGYWGQDVQYNINGGVQSTLAHYCSTNLYSIIIMAFLSDFYITVPSNVITYTLNFANMGGFTTTSPSAPLTAIAADIKTCQAAGVKILLSLGGANGNHIIRTGEADKWVTFFHNTFFGGSAAGVVRPFGSTVLDGLDFDIEQGSAVDQVELGKIGTKLKQMNSGMVNSAAPQCIFPDASLGTFLGVTSAYDFMNIQFYNNPSCELNSPGGGFASSFTTWKNAFPTVPLLIGLPANIKAAGASNPNGYQASVSTNVKHETDGLVANNNLKSHWGGFMLWDVSAAEVTASEPGASASGTNYAAGMANLLKSY